MSLPQRQQQNQLQYSQNYNSYKSQDAALEKSDISETLLESSGMPDYALVQHPIIPLVWRILMPILILLNIGLFVWSNMSVGAYVYLQLNVEGMTTPKTELKRFTLIGSTIDMWKAEVYALNTMGKWSLLDSYVMVLMVVAFRFSILEKFQSLSGGVDVFVIPGFGIYSFVLGTIFSLMITHVEIHYHRKTIEHKIKRDLSLVSKLQPKQMAKVHIGTGILAFAFIFLLVGYLVDAFTFKFLGAAAWILGEGNSATNYSMMSLGYHISKKALNATFGIYFLEIMFFMFSLVIPAVFLTVITILWLKPMTLKRQRSLFTAAEILNAWSTVDVFIVSIVVSLVEIRQFAQFIIGSDCDLINEWLKYLSDEKVIILDEASCFDVETTLLSGCGLLFGSATMYFIMSTVMIRYIQRNMESKLKKGKLNAERQLMVKDKGLYSSDFESTEVETTKRQKHDGSLKI